MAGVRMADLPYEFVAVLSAEVVDALAGRYAGPPVLLVARADRHLAGASRVAVTRLER